MEVPASAAGAVINACKTDTAASGALLAPVDADTEVWAAGVTYLRSREARMRESDTADVYDKVYDAARPEVFFKCMGWRARGPCENIRVRRDATWNVPEPELGLVNNCAGEIIGYTAGNDVSSRDIEGTNPLYLPQAKVYDGACALGPAIVLCGAERMGQLPIVLSIVRGGETLFEGSTGIGQMKRSLEELVACLYQELTFPGGSVLLTGAGIVPGDDFTLTPGDRVTIKVGHLQLANTVDSTP
ncbi:MAG: fumarylacetoacetate hydrolase [Gammaproteobacteria bacterium]|nr:fumarylacetoacetate hydrolase [Gammaproteobacteria bacterium]